MPEDSIPQKPFGIIYCFTNKVNGKKYVGLTTTSLDRRYRGYKGDALFPKALRKYGRDSFAVEVIDRADSKEELLKKEIHWIKAIGSKAPQGYNLTDGGEGSLNPTAETRAKLAAAVRGKPGPMKDREFSAEHRKKLSEYRKRWCHDHPLELSRKHSAESREKMSKAKIGKVPKGGRKGIPQPREAVEKTSAANRGRKHSVETRAKIAAANRRRWAEYRAKQSAPHQTELQTNLTCQIRT